MADKNANVQTQTHTDEAKLSNVKKSQLEGDYKVFYVGKMHKVKGTRGDFIAVSVGIENAKGGKAWLSLTEQDAYRVIGITSARDEEGHRINISGVKAVKSGTYTNLYFIIKPYIPDGNATASSEVGDLGDFEEILSNPDVPF